MKMKKFNGLTRSSVRFFKAIPLIFGLAAIVAAPTVGAVTTNLVNIIQGFFDVNQDGIIDGADDLNNVAFWFDEGAPARCDIIDGEVDVNEGGSINAQDDLFNVDLNDENTVNGNNGVPSKNQVDFRDGVVDVDEDSILNEIADDALVNVQLFVLP
jgi:hypothetical protein